jgi:hypothetical protein
MTGPEHYAEAERLLTEAAGLQVDYEDASTLPLLTRAQVHATLALAAATALNPTGEDFISEKHWPEYEAWTKVCSVTPPEVSP